MIDIIIIKEIVMVNYYKTPPEGYKVYKVIDATDKKVGIRLNLVALAIILVILAGLYFLLLWGYKLTTNDLIVYLIVMILGYVAYIVTHELLHGLAYKLLTKQKLTFGLTLTVAFCGLKEGYVNKKTALISILAPFVVHSLWMIPCLFLIEPSGLLLAIIFLFASHVGGCVGDFYGTITLIKAPSDVLMCDTGPKQTFLSATVNKTEENQ